MSKNYIDITFSISSKLPKWPGSIDFKKNVHSKMPFQVNNTSSFIMDSHFGTHIDAPLHFVMKGQSIDELELENLIGDVCVIEIYGTGSINFTDLEQASIPKNCKKLIIKTDNQDYWSDNIKEFRENFTGLDSSGANWIVKRGIHLVGIDYLSIQRFKDGPETHQILLENGVIILESLKLDDVKAGLYELICLPIKLEGFEGAPVRAVLKIKTNE
uniref:cyclase family protein n=2 Tax=Flavobacterium sp. TaxID=239 RepID=UPI00404B04F0